MTKSNPREYPLWEGSCAYAVRLAADKYEIIVFSSNHTTHKVYGEQHQGDLAEQTVRRLNAYPKQTRHYMGLH